MAPSLPATRILRASNYRREPGEMSGFFLVEGARSLSQVQRIARANHLKLVRPVPADAVLLPDEMSQVAIR